MYKSLASGDRDPFNIVIRSYSPSFCDTFLMEAKEQQKVRSRPNVHLAERIISTPRCIPPVIKLEALMEIESMLWLH